MAKRGERALRAGYGGLDGIQRFDRFDKDRLAWNGVYPFKAGGTGQEHLWVLFFCFQGHNGEDRLAKRCGRGLWAGCTGCCVGSLGDFC